MEAPIPTPRLDDDEDVHWALSTASALWGRGERTEALKWLRRAAEQASDVNADVRALELFKAAAEVANQVSSAPPPAPPAPPAEATPRPPPAPPARKPGPPGPAPRAGSVYPPPPVAAHQVAPQQAPARPPSIPAPPRPAAPSVPPARTVPPPPLAPAAQARTAPPVVVPSRPIAITATRGPAAPQAITPKRRRSFTGEARPGAGADKTRSPEPARSARGNGEGAARAAAPPQQQPARAPEGGTHKRRSRTFSDDETTGPRQPLRDGPDFPSEATTVMPVVNRAHVRAAVEQSSIFDDLDEDTRVLSARHASNDEIDQALERLRSTPAPIPSAPRTEPGRPGSFHEELTTDGTLANGPSSSTTSPSTNRWHVNASPQASPRAESGSPTERPPAAQQAAAPAPRRLETLPALRVAVLGTGIAGEVRLISLGSDEPPPGAAVAVLVPLSAADGDAVARLFGALE